MALDPMWMRVVHGNSTYTLLEPNKLLSPHGFVAGLRAWESGQVNKATLVAAMDLTHVDDSASLDAVATAGSDARTAGLLSIWFHELEMRLILGQTKETGGVLHPDGMFGFAITQNILEGADLVHDMRSQPPVPTAQRFTNWASN